MSLMKIPSSLPVAPGNQYIYKKTFINKKGGLPSNSQNTKEASFNASFRKASYTIEAAIVLPLFLTAMIFGMFLFRMLEVHSGVQQAMDLASRTMAVVGKSESGGLVPETIAYTNLLIGEYDVPLEYVTGGVLGLDYTQSSVDGNYLDMRVNYYVKFPIGLLGRIPFYISQESKNRIWVGYDPTESAFLDEYVFLSTYSEVYHRDSTCSYLSPSVMSVAFMKIGTKRNKSQHKYYPCRYCKGDKNNGIVYVTDYGTSYHSDKNCGSIRRNIRKVLLEEAKALYPECSKCGGKR